MEILTMSACRHITLASTLALVLIGIGCDSMKSSSTGTNQPKVGFALEPSTREILAGETVTITARTQDTLGRDAEVKWSTTSGKLTTEQNGRIARVKFDEPGTYTVNGMLMVNGREVRREMTEIRVRPLN